MSDDRPSLTLVRTFRAPPARVFAAWTDPALMMRWFGPEGTRVESAEADPKVGGRFRVVMHTPDGERHEVSGVYDIVEPDKKLGFSWAWVTMPERESRVRVSFEPAPEGTTMTLLHERFADQAARDGHEEGWTESMLRLAAALEDNKEN